MSFAFTTDAAFGWAPVPTLRAGTGTRTRLPAAHP
jgi:hypothetical protein